jgi:hypothetical protein
VIGRPVMTVEMRGLRGRVIRCPGMTGELHGVRWSTRRTRARHPLVLEPELCVWKELNKFQQVEFSYAPKGMKQREEY